MHAGCLALRPCAPVSPSPQVYDSAIVRRSITGALRAMAALEAELRKLMPIAGGIVLAPAPPAAVPMAVEGAPAAAKAAKARTPAEIRRQALYGPSAAAQFSSPSAPDPFVSHLRGALAGAGGVREAAGAPSTSSAAALPPEVALPAEAVDAAMEEPADEAVAMDDASDDEEGEFFIDLPVDEAAEAVAAAAEEAD